jgi:hypothetical protein
MRDTRRMKSPNMAVQIKGQQNGTADWLSVHPHCQKLVQIGQKVGQETVREEKVWEVAGQEKAAEERKQSWMQARHAWKLAFRRNES